MKGTYKIAELLVYMDIPCERLEKTALPYKVSSEELPNVDFKIFITEQQILNLLKKYNNSGTFEEAAYILSSSVFNRKIINFNAIMLHSSSIKFKGYGIAFSANSGTGKSTHTSTWYNYFKDKNEKVEFINDDKPIIRKINDKYYIFGSPWSGKTDLNNNISAPLKAVVFLQQAKQNELFKIDNSKAAFLFIEQTVRPKNKNLINKAFDTVSDIVKNIENYGLKCTIGENAVKEALKIFNE